MHRIKKLQADMKPQAALFGAGRKQLGVAHGVKMICLALFFCIAVAIGLWSLGCLTAASVRGGGFLELAHEWLNAVRKVW